ncbi:cell cycle checkpoint [Auriculariales sp. MPI-PUGE-AT-0066]|nr:cell cycle checkpoint [Auriculariales sp. MPI-PUGE-AT-0066]
MRFRAAVENVQTFYRVLQSLEKLSKRCMIKLNETTMRIICLPGDTGIQLWSNIRITHIFTDYRIQSNNNNEITFEMSTEPLLAALKSALSSPEVVLKLTKKNEHATWSFEVALQSAGGKRINVTHDVRVTVMRPADVARIQEPLCPEPDVHIVVPPLAKLRVVVDHLQKLSSTVAVRANRNEIFRLAAQTDHVEVETEWTGCAHPAMDEVKGEDDSDPNDFSTVLVSIKAFVRFMSCHVVSTTTIAGLCQNHCIIMYVYIGEIADAGGVLTFYIPALTDGDEE